MPADADTVTPLCSYSQFTEGAFADLVTGFSQQAVTNCLVEATRRCEDATDRRLAPFTGLTETCRASGIDSDEYAGSPNMPMSLTGALGESYASAIGIQNLVRHTWLDQFPARYPDLWSFALTSVIVIRSYGGEQVMGPGQILDGPDDTGHVWFQLGQFIPVGSRIRVVYNGGYSTIPGSLKRACEFIAASIIIDELNPESNQRNPDRLLALGMSWLGGFYRNGKAP